MGNIFNINGGKFSFNGKIDFLNEKKNEIYKEINLSNIIRQLIIKTTSININIEKGDNNKAVLKGYYYGENSPELITKSFKDDMFLEIKEDNVFLEDCTLTITLRHCYDLRINSISGDICVLGLNIYITDFRTTSGDITYNGYSDDLALYSTSGDVKFKGFVKSGGIVTTSGDIKAELDNTENSQLRTISTSGDTTIICGNYKNVELMENTVSGDIKIITDPKNELMKENFKKNRLDLRPRSTSGDILIYR